MRRVNDQKISHQKGAGMGGMGGLFVDLSEPRLSQCTDHSDRRIRLSDDDRRQTAFAETTDA